MLNIISFHKHIFLARPQPFLFFPSQAIPPLSNSIIMIIEIDIPRSPSIIRNKRLVAFRSLVLRVASQHTL